MLLAVLAYGQARIGEHTLGVKLVPSRLKVYHGRTSVRKAAWEDIMETFEHRYSTILVIAQHGPNEGKPFFGFVNLKTTWAEWEAKLHHQVAQLAAIDQGCATEPIVCCD